MPFSSSCSVWRGDQSARFERTPILMLTALVEEDPSKPTGESERGGLTFVSKTTRLDKILAIIERSLAG